MIGPLLHIESLRVYFPKNNDWLPGIDGASLSIKRGTILGLVGESGSGKSLTALSVLRLVPNPGFIYSGKISFDGQELLRLREKDMVALRGKKIGTIFQNPMSSLNPTVKIGKQIAEMFYTKEGLSWKISKEKATELIREVGIQDVYRVFHSYPHEISGGMCQRITIAIAVSLNPSLLIADEPTTALDVTTQAHILELLKDLKESFDMSILFITHDLGVIAQIADEVAVMYLGRIVERAETTAIFSSPLHPYTEGLIHAIPDYNRKTNKLTAIPGNAQMLPLKDRKGCLFRSRCYLAKKECEEIIPDLTVKQELDHEVACLLKGH